MYKICIDPGHGGSDPGACQNGMRECDIALIVSQATKANLQAVGYDVVMTRETDVDVAYPGASATDELQARCNISDNFGADVFISIHADSFTPNPDAKGSGTFYYKDSPQGYRLAQLIQSQLLGLGMEDHGIRYTPLYVTGNTAAVAVLVEVAFMTNPEDAAKLADPAWREEFAKAIARGVTDFYAEVGA